jgi:hypothetical protein
MKKIIISNLFALVYFLSGVGFAQQTVSVSINAMATKKTISPYLYGKNNSLSDNAFNINNQLTEAEWQYLRDLGVQMFRENGGNNATKYNWRLKLSSHPDWYNNVYGHDWDYAAQSLQANIPAAQGMWAFQLIGKAAKTGSNNFPDWSYNNSQWWAGVRQNLCGGGVVNETGGEDALVEGDTSLYLQHWNADSTTGILDHWFGSSGIGLNPAKIQYWNMDNEPEIWSGTHDDVYPVQPDAETFMQSYFAVAKKARAKYPDIKLMGPVPANEWQWYNWNGGKINYEGKDYTWLEYFILRCAEEQQASGIRLLDVLDIHFYPGETSPADIVQLHRVFFDQTYNYPGANGVKKSGPGGWDNNLTKEYIFKRCNDWLIKYLGANHGVTLSVSETSIAKRDDPNLTASWYASNLGEFAKQGVEIFTPWDWFTGMSEVIHLFTHYGQKFYINGTSSEEQYVSAYPTMNYNSDSMTIFFINRHLTESRLVDLNLSEFAVKDGTYKLYTLSNLPQSETFVSHAVNALKTTSVASSANEMSITLTPLSVSALVLTRNPTFYNQFGERLISIEAENGVLNGVTTATSVPGYSGTGYVTGFDDSGDNVRVSFNIPVKDLYKVVIRYLGGNGESTQNLSVNNSFTTSVTFPASATFTDIDAGGFVLQQGNNTLTISKDLGSSDIDRIEIYLIDKKTYNISPELVDTAATDATKALYAFLQYQFGDRIISGQTHDYYGQVETLTGKSPLLRAGDFQSYTNGYPYLWSNEIGGHTFGKFDNGTVSSLINWYNSTGKKGIVSLHWHWHSPTGGAVSTNTFYTEYTNFDITRAVTPGTPEYDSIINDIDEIAVQLKRFQDAGVPILWRPLHEAGGGWFWWGAKGPEACKELYNILYDRLKNYHQLHNLIWVWSTPEPDWYPGNDKVDIIGHDSYPGSYNYGNQISAFDALYMLTRGEKLIAMTENGPIPDPDACLQQDAPWLYFMSWSNLVVAQNSGAHIQQVYDNPIVLTVESTNFKTNNEWRSSLYPEDWKPGYKDAQGRFLHDFSYAGYHMGETEIPHNTMNVTDVTLPPYNADNTGINDVTQTIQQALDDAGIAGGGVVYLPAGTYKIAAADTSSYGLRIAYDSTVLRGAGTGLTFLLNYQTNMRYKDIIRVMGSDANWFEPEGTTTAVSFDIPELTRVIPVESITGFTIGDLVVLTSTPTPEFIAEHKMTGNWTASSIKGVAFLRRIDSIDIKNNLLIIDAPTRYFLKTRDDARVYHAKEHISECGIENLSIGNLQNPDSGWEEESYSLSGTGAYEVHNSHVIQFKYSENCWAKNVSTFKPSGNAGDFNILSNGLKLNQSRFITIDSCSFEKPQYEGGGGNGYMFTLESNDCLIKNSRANHGRHNFDFKYPYSNGNVILRSRGENAKYASDFHMYLSMSNLFDACAMNGDYLESAFRPYGGDAIHGYTSTQSVFYNTTGEAYHPDKSYIIDSRQFGWGYIIGTLGPASNVVIDPAEGSLNGYLYNTTPRDFTEGIGKGNDLRPVSLYLDQLDRRLHDSSSMRNFHVEIIVRDAASNELLPGCMVQLYNDSIFTNEAGIAAFNSVPEFFLIDVKKDYCIPIEKKQFFIYSDTSITLFLTKERYDVTIKLLRANTFEAFNYTSVTFSSTTQVTNVSGEAAFTVYGGPHEYSINKASYQPESGSVTIQSDTTIYFYLIQTHAYAKFVLKKATTPVNMVMLVVNEDTLFSNSLGIATFNQLPVSTGYTFLLKKDGYMQKEGAFYLTRDTTIDVAMEIKTPTVLVPENGMKTEFWPNPVDDVLNLTLPGDYTDKIVRITDLRGIEVLYQKIDRNNLKIDVKNYPSGTYILQTISGDVHTTQFFIKK